MKIYSQHTGLPAGRDSQKGSANTPSRRLKGQIDAILKNDYSVLSRHPNADHNSLLTKHNNSLILKYVKNIYQEYNIKDPMPNWNSRVKTEPNEPQLLRSSKKKAKLHLYSNSTYSPYRTPYRTDQNSPSQILKTEPIPQPFDIDPQALDQVESQDTIKKYDNRQQTTTLKASNSYFDNRSNQQSFTSPLNQHSTFIQPDRFTISRKHKKTKEMRIQTEGDFSYIDQNQEQGEFQLPSTPTLPAVSLFTSDPQNSNKNPPAFVPLNIEGAQQAQSRLMMPFPLPEIVTLRGSTPLQLKQIKETYRYCIGCEQALLEANIQLHQKICQQFQKVLFMDAADIIQHLKSKIRKFEGTIKKYSQQLLAGDAADIGEHSRLLLNESSNIVGKGEFTAAYEKEYGSVVEISRKWCLMTQEINKVNWFLKIRQRVRKQLQL